jgi:PAS domain S-box-containing protein
MTNEARETEPLTGPELDRSGAMDQMARAAALLGAAGDVSETALAVVDQALAFGAIASHLMLADPDRRTIRLAAERNLPPDLLPRLAVLPFDAPLLAARAALTGAPQTIADVRQVRPGLQLAVELATRVGARSISSWPLMIGGQLLGVLTWLWKAPHPPLPTLEIEAICRLFAVGLHHALVLDELEESRRALMVDMAERERAEEALRVSEQRFRLSIDNAPIGMALVGLDGRFLQVNRTLCEIVGYPADALMKLRFQDITHPQDLETDLALADKLWRGLIPRYSLGKRYLHKDGHVVHVMLHGSVVRDAAGNPLHAIAQVEDVTEQRRAEHERRVLLSRVERKRALLQTVLDSVPVGIASIRRDGSWDVANEAMLELMGGPIDLQEGSRTLLSRLSLADGKHAELRDLPSWRALEGERIDWQEYRLQRDGGTITLRASAVPVRGADGAIEAAILVAEDVETAKQLERLRQEWISVVTHDLRQPIGVIKIQASTGCCASGSDCRGMRTIRRNADRLERMVSDLLDFAQVEAKRLRVERGEVDLPELVLAAVEGARAYGDAEMSVHVSGEISPIRGDAQRIEQVLGNLISNAVKYRSPGTPIRIEIDEREDEVMVSVVNEGEGIPEAERERLFDRFHRTARARERTSGLGLGLYITRGLVEAHGGRIWVESIPGGTTAFRFTLPEAARVDTAGNRPTRTETWSRR